jgi:hypothetical protein
LARFTANTSTATKSYAVTLIVRGKTTTVDHWQVIQSARVPPTTTATAPPTTTTTTKDPPTAVAIVASESPAMIGDVITYSMTVADVLTATQGAVYMTDNGADPAELFGARGDESRLTVIRLRRDLHKPWLASNSMLVRRWLDQHEHHRRPAFVKPRF